MTTTDQDSAAGVKKSLSRSERAFLALGFTAILCLVLWVTSGVFRGAGGEREEGPRRLAPEFELPLLSGEDFKLSDHRGKTLILDFWATWCAPCEIQMPVLDTLDEQRGGPDLMVLGISVDTDPAAKVEAWLKERGLDYAIGLGSAELAQRYGALGFPSLFVIDPDGGIHTQHTGVLSRPELEDILEEIALEHRPGS